MRIGVDLGGTNVRVALVQDGEILKIQSEPCKAQEAEMVVVNHICDMISALITEEVDHIGIGVPSIVDVERGIVYNVANIPSWKEVHLKELLEERFGVNVEVNNDCNYFALGVSNFGEGRGYDDVLGVTLGTGVGVGVVAGKRLYMGHNVCAGEIGSISYLDSDIETYCSSQFFVKHNTTGLAAFEGAKSGDVEMQKIWDEFGQHIGSMVMTLIFAYDPQVIVIGGSISNAFELYAPSMYRKLEEFPYPNCIKNLKIEVAKIPNVSILGSTMRLTPDTVAV